jgi:hypothetical protein
MENVNKINNLAYLDIFSSSQGVWLSCTPKDMESSFEALALLLAKPMQKAAPKPF